MISLRPEGTSLRLLLSFGILLALSWNIYGHLSSVSSPLPYPKFDQLDKRSESTPNNASAGHDLLSKRGTDPQTCLKQFAGSGKPPANGWNPLVTTGDWLSTVMWSGSIDDKQGQKEWCTKQSQFTDFTGLANNGWVADGDFARDVSGDKFASLRQLYDGLGISAKKEDNRAWYFKQSKKVTIDGKAYEPTGAIYNNIYNPKAIFAESNFGPATQAKAKMLLKQFQNGKIPYYPLTPLRQWSDVTFLAFQQNCQKRSNGNKVEFNACMKGLKVIVRSKISNPDTVKLAQHILKCTQNGDSRLKAFKDAKQYSLKDTDIAKALLQTANGAGVTWFLGQHKEQLGWKVVEKVVMYSCNGGPAELCIAFIIADRADLDPPPSPGSRPAIRARARDNLIRAIAGTNPPPGQGGASHGQCEVPTTQPKKKTWDDYVRIGAHWMNLLNSEATRDDQTGEETYCVEQSQWTDFAALEKNGWTQQWANSWDEEDVMTDGTAEMYKTLGLSERDEDNYDWQWTQNHEATIDGTKYEPTFGAFANIYNPKMIAALSNDSPYHKELARQITYEAFHPGHKSDCRPIVPLQRWSDVTFLLWQERCRRTSIPAGGHQPDAAAAARCVQGLEVILRSFVVNEVTQEVAKEALRKKTGSELLRVYDDAAHFSTDTDEGKALLATPNGGGIYWLLSQHRKQLGWKIVHEVVLFGCADDYEWKLCIAYLLKNHE